MVSNISPSDISRYKHVVGIDLGTSHAAVSSWTQGDTQMRQWKIPQLSDWGQWEESYTLPTACYIPSPAQEQELRALPEGWEPQEQSPLVFGAITRKLAVSSPKRVIGSSKSWLCHPFAEREQKILPWEVMDESVPKFSPVEVATELLRYLKQVVTHGLCAQLGDALDWEQDVYVVVTIPASFDEEAKKLTSLACTQAGLTHVRLLEEPTAALYAWIYRHHMDWKKSLSSGQTILVCDVGGGTTDFSLIVAREGEHGSLHLERAAVGEHLLLGGDNMDLALAHLLQQKIEKEQSRPLSGAQIASLTASARLGKEALLSSPVDAPNYHIAVASVGSRLMQKTLRVELTPAEVEACVLDGFFPLVEREEECAQDVYGVAELGLPYATEPRITAHLAEFLRVAALNCAQSEKFADLLTEGVLRPDWVLFNGGVFSAASACERIMACLQKITGVAGIKALPSLRMDTAVAEGACYLGSALVCGEGVRIATGTSRSYYLGVESSAPAVPGVLRKLQGICVAPQGTEEGSDLPPLARKFALIAGRKIRFRFFSSKLRAADQVGDLVSEPEQHLDELSPLEMDWSALAEGGMGRVPVELAVHLSETGLLELFFVESGGQRRWELSLNLRRRDQSAFPA